MDPQAFRILEKKRRGETLSSDEVRRVVAAAVDGSWGDAELAAWLMAAAIRGLDVDETGELTRAMLASGESWDLAGEVPRLGDKHSTGGVGDKVSLVLAPLMAACGRPVVMLTGRGLGHTGGTADKLESIPGLDLGLDRELCLKALRDSGLAIGLPTGSIAPADARIYALRDRTATIDSLPLITASILSKKLATGAAAMVFDVKTGSGAFFPELEDSRALARMLVDTSAAVGKPARALVTDMSQPLGRWVGHTAEVREALDCLEGNGPEDLMTVTHALCGELAEMTGEPLRPGELDGAVASGRARERFVRWAEIQGADRDWLRSPRLPLAPEEVAIPAARSGRLAAVATRRLGELLASAGGGRSKPGAAIDDQVALEVRRRLGDEVEAGDALARLYLRRRDERLEAEFRACFTVADDGEAVGRLVDRIA